jgi:hypothetical protein
LRIFAHRAGEAIPRLNLLTQVLYHGAECLVFLLRRQLVQRVDERIAIIYLRSGIVS